MKNNIAVTITLSKSNQNTELGTSICVLNTPYAAMTS